MIEYLNVTKTLAVSSDKVWSAIRGIGGLEHWFSIIATCRVSGAGIGAVRVMELTDGAEIKDRIEEINDAARRFRYTRTESPFPVSHYLGTVEVRDDNGKTALSWSLELDVNPEVRDDLVSLLTGALSEGIDGLEQDLQRNDAHHLV